MKHLIKFEELDYKELLAQQSRLKSELEKSREADIEKRRREISGQTLSKLADESEKSKNFEKNLAERQNLTHIVIQSLIFSEQNKPGFENFKKELSLFLEEYPLDKLPKSGVSIYRD